MQEGQTTAKTEICNCWLEFDACPYGEKCTFAHGFQQLQQRTDRQKQNELCKSYQFEGVCYYGKRCKFRHDQVLTGKTEQPCFSLVHKDHMITDGQFNSSAPVYNDRGDALTREELQVCKLDKRQGAAEARLAVLDGVLKQYLG